MMSNRISNVTVRLAAFSIAMVPTLAGAQPLDGMADPNLAPIPSGDTAAAADGAARSARPIPKSVGVGLGTTISGNDILQPNTASVRFGLSETFVIEPFVRLAFSKATNDPEQVTLPTTNTDTTNFGIGAKGRMLLKGRGPVDLDFLGSAMLQHTSVDPSGPAGSNNQDISLNWGLGLSWYFSSWWALSLDAMNPVVSFSREETDNVRVETSWTAGLVFAPTVIAMLHLYL